MKIYFFDNSLVLSRRGPRPPGHTFLKPEKHETLSIYINAKWGVVGDFFFFYIIATNSNDVWNENSLSSSQKRKTLLRSVSGDRDAQFQA